MNVDAPKGGHVQHLLREDPAVSYHGADIRLQGPEGRHRLLLPEIFRLEDRDPRVQSHFLHRAGGQLHAPALGPVRLGIDSYHLEAVCQDPFQAGGRNVRSAHKDNTHGHPSSMTGFSIRRGSPYTQCRPGGPARGRSIGPSAPRPLPRIHCRPGHRPGPWRSWAA